MNYGYVIFRGTDFRAVMEGTNACSVRWGHDPERVRLYATWGEAEQALRLLTDSEDEALIGYADIWFAESAKKEGQ